MFGGPFCISAHNGLSRGRSTPHIRFRRTDEGLSPRVSRRLFRRFVPRLLRIGRFLGCGVGERVSRLFKVLPCGHVLRGQDQGLLETVAARRVAPLGETELASAEKGQRIPFPSLIRIFGLRDALEQLKSWGITGTATKFRRHQWVPVPGGPGRTSVIRGCLLGRRSRQEPLQLLIQLASQPGVRGRIFDLRLSQRGLGPVGGLGTLGHPESQQ